MQNVSVSLRSIIHSYKIIKNRSGKNERNEFPSPYGVSFILIEMLENWLVSQLGYEFPSPYGVSFILIMV